MSDKIEDGGAAFPHQTNTIYITNGHEDGGCLQEHQGLTKRELFAAMAMQGFAACPDIYGDANMMAKGSVELADALLAKLRKGGE